MMTYRVRWEIDEEAENHAEAARQARQSLLDPSSDACVFEVRQHSPNVRRAPAMTVDLSEMDRPFQSASESEPKPYKWKPGGTSLLSNEGEKPEVIPVNLPFERVPVSAEDLGLAGPAGVVAESTTIRLDIWRGVVNGAHGVPPGVVLEVHDMDPTYEDKPHCELHPDEHCAVHEFRGGE